MNNIRVLDCTLRDGGYCNEWNFGAQNLETILLGLVDAEIDIIECGFLSNRVKYNPDISKFPNVETINRIIPERKKKSLFVCMMNYGEFDPNELPEKRESSLDGIRLAFHKKDRKEALELAKVIKAKGYLLFLQPMVSLNYTDEEFLELIRLSNDLDPYAFYIVDSFGSMKQKELLHFFYMTEFNLDENILIGFHGHNNLQLAFSNALALLQVPTKRTMIIDSSVSGMGRGAGNLNTELFVEHLNDENSYSYNVKPLLQIIDEILGKFYQKNYWGYSLANYLSATRSIHPNYANFLEQKNKLTLQDINEIFSLMEEEKKWEYDEPYIKKVYYDYVSADESTEGVALQSFWRDKEVLIIGPGKTSEIEKENICRFVADRALLTLSVNFEYNYLKSDYIFVANGRRFRELKNKDFWRIIATSNIKDDNIVYHVDYAMLMNELDTVSDNAGMMAIKYLLKCNAKKIWLAGLDGYSIDDENNYADKKMSLHYKKGDVIRMNSQLKQAIRKFSEEIEIEFLTSSNLQ